VDCAPGDVNEAGGIAIGIGAAAISSGVGIDNVGVVDKPIAIAAAGVALAVVRDLKRAERDSQSRKERTRFP